jgi:hypothetical protein
MTNRNFRHSAAKRSRGIPLQYACDSPGSFDLAQDNGRHCSHPASSLDRLGGDNCERGGSVGPTIIGAMKDRFGTHGPGFMVLGGCAIVGPLLAMCLGRASVVNPLKR